MEVDRIIKKRVYVAGDAIYSPLGFTTQENLDSILSYRSGIEKIEENSLYYKSFYGAKIINDAFGTDFSFEAYNNYTVLEKRIIYSIKEAIRSSNISDLEKFLNETVLILSTTKGNIDILKDTDKEIDEGVYLTSLADKIAQYLGIKETPLVISNACISGVNAIITASRLIERDVCKHAVVVGADLLSRFVVTGFQAFHSISSNRCLPYDLNRDGLSLGEAVGVIILTSQREKSKDQNPVVVEGGAVTNDANHLSAPSRTGDGLGTAILESMKNADVVPDEIDFVNAHGTATLYNDEMESKAVYWANLQECIVQSSKPYWGHTLGASGVIESIACFWQMKNDTLLATMGFKELGVPMKINVSGEHKLQKTGRCVKTASGFGGCNAAVVYALESYSKSLKTIEERGWVLIDTFKLKGESEFSSIIREYNRELNNKDLKFFKMDDLTKLGSTGASFLLKNHPWTENIPVEKRGLFLANFSSSLNSDIKHQHIIESQGDQMASPAVFVYTLPNIVLGEISIKNKFQGENTFFILPKEKRDSAVASLLDFAKQTNLELVIAGWCEHFGENFDLNIELYKRENYE